MLTRSTKKVVAACTGLLIAASTVTGCGNQDGSQPAQAFEEDGGAYFYSRVQYIREEVAPNVVESRTLAEALPCGKAPTRLDLIVDGEVLDVAPGDGIVWGDEEDSVRLTKFDDPNADERDVVLTIQPARAMTSGGDMSNPEPVTVRMGVLGGSDPDRFVASLDSLERVTALLAVIPDGAHKGEYYPAYSGAGLGAADGETLTFPGLGKSQEKFLGGTTSTDELFASCR
jgi:hypothetical protein